MEMTILYEVGESLYVNLTNHCPCACTFCLRQTRDHMENSGSLWLAHTPDLSEVLAEFAKFDMTRYREIVFCGFGEPMEALSVLLEVAKYCKAHYSQPIRINTNGLADLITGRNAALELDGKVDAVSVSLNASTAEGYEAICHSQYGLQAFPAILKFTSTAVFNVPHVRMTVVSTMPKEEIDACKRVCEKIGADFFVREYIDK